MADTAQHELGTALPETGNRANQTEQTERSLSKGGFRMTRQRQVIFNALLDITEQHPTATEVFMRVKESMPSISLATVYNTLETLAQVDAVKQVNVDRAPTRYCANLSDHAHFHCSECGRVIDAPVNNTERLSEAWFLPEGTRVTSHDVVLKGICPECARSGLHRPQERTG